MGGNLDLWFSAVYTPPTVYTFVYNIANSYIIYIYMVLISYFQ